MTEAFVLADRVANFPEAETLVLTDPHVGRDAASELELPLGERADLRERLAAARERFDPATVVVAGDVLHSFGTVPPSVPDTLDALAETVRENGATLRLLAGNHDTMLASLADAPVQATYRLDDRTVVAHGHDVPAVDAERYVVGHDHPAIRIEGDRRPCALDCEDQHGGADVVVLPAFTRLAKGTVVNSLSAGEAMSPLVTNLDRCRPVVATSEKPLRFPPLGEFRSLL
ncbi:MAG: metallophosphoesterase [Halanaeroarchaeum sp.]